MQYNKMFLCPNAITLRFRPVSVLIDNGENQHLLHSQLYIFLTNHSTKLHAMCIAIQNTRTYIIYMYVLLIYVTWTDSLHTAACPERSGSQAKNPSICPPESRWQAPAICPPRNRSPDPPLTAPMYSFPFRQYS